MPDLAGERLRGGLVLVALTCATVAGARAAAQAGDSPLLVFHGNVVLIDGVYRSVLDLPANARATPELARDVRARLRKFLHEAGYELASVRTAVAGDRIDVEIDEGRLDKVIILGSGVIETLRLKFDLDFPFKVFNRPDLDRKLGELSRKLGLSNVSYELVPVAMRPDSGLQLDEIPSLQPLSLFEPGRPYELHITVAPGSFRPGISPDVEINSLQGAGIGAEYRNGRLLLPDDRWSVQGKIAAAIRQRLDNSGSSLVVTHGALGGRWQSSPLLRAVRPSLSLRADLINRQRSDVQVESFQYATLEGSLDLEVGVGRIWSASIGGGFQRRWLYSVEPAGGAVALVSTAPLAESRDFVQANLGVTFDPLELRRDRRHELHFGIRQYGRAAGSFDSATQVHAQYQKIFGLGWNELWIDGRATLLAGDVLFADEESISEALHGSFSSRYARKLVGAGAEFRYSLLRDVVKVGLFDEVVLFGTIDRARGSESLRVADSFGIGFHALFLDAFELDLYAGLALSRKADLGSGVTLSIRQAY